MTVWVSSRALRDMCNEALALHPLESGGVLLGWRSGADWVVIDITGPGPLAMHGRHRFLPDHIWQVEEIHRVFRGSKGDIDYLGDWHSHPDGVAAMSAEDCSTLKRISKRVVQPLMLIVAGGTADTEWRASCWCGSFSRIFFYRQFEEHPQELRVFEPPQHWPSRGSTSDWEETMNSLGEKP